MKSTKLSLRNYVQKISEKKMIKTNKKAKIIQTVFCWKQNVSIMFMGYKVNFIQKMNVLSDCHLKMGFIFFKLITNYILDYLVKFKGFLCGFFFGGGVG